VIKLYYKPCNKYRKFKYTPSVVKLIVIYWKRKLFICKLKACSYSNYLFQITSNTHKAPR